MHLHDVFVVFLKDKKQLFFGEGSGCQEYLNQSASNNTSHMILPHLILDLQKDGLDVFFLVWISSHVQPFQKFKNPRDDTVDASERPSCNQLQIVVKPGKWMVAIPYNLLFAQLATLKLKFTWHQSRLNPP